MLLSICWQFQRLPYLSPFARYWQWNCTWSLPIEHAKRKCKYANGKAVCDFIFVDNSNVYPVTICKKFTIEMCMTLTLTFRMAPRSNLNMLIERPHATFYALAIAMFALYVTICKIITFELPKVFNSNIWPWK